MAVSLVLIPDDQGIQKAVYYMSKAMTNPETRQVMQKLEALGRMIKWLVELSEFDLTYKPRSAIKGQAIADFISEFTAKDSSAAFYSEGDP
ncbi:hypothetical protein ACOSQ4_025109 [Xanthoceras sorbifolium]